jgi:UDP-GlcNAc:undecaprenyl-phosphate GlcNAc-1-phosphate transferase
MFVDLSGLAGFTFFTALAVAAVVCACARPIAERFGVWAHPDSLRRRHAAATPQVGGIAILLALTLWVCATFITGQIADKPLMYSFLICGMGVGLVGFADDQSHTSPTSRILSLLVFVAAALIIEPEFILRVVNWGSFAPTTIPTWVFVLLLSVAAVGLVNAVNMADGQNGVVGSMYVVWAFCLFCVSSGTSATIAALLFAASLIFLAFNLRGKLFLGDCGSYGVTFVIGLLTLLAHARGQVSFEAIIVWFFIPVMDCLRLLTTRPLRGRSPFVGDRDHFHHRLEDKMGKNFGLLSYAGAVATSSVLATLEPRFTLVCLAGLSAFYFSFAWLTDSEAAQAVQVGADETHETADGADADNVLSIREIRGERQRDAG